MSARFRSPAALAAVSGVLALGVAGCASEGVIGASGATGGTLKAPASSGPTAPASTASTAGSSSAPPTSAPASSAAGTTSAAPPTSAPTSSAGSNPADLTAALQKLNTLWKDPGCKLGLHGFGSYMTAFQTSPDKGAAAIPGAIHDLRAGAGATKRPNAAKAMTDMAKDLQGIADATKAGKPVDRGPLRNDWTIMGNSCG
ncbi:MAG: hypothetical protein HOV87_27945 [Catenulispora sp.]|nr:hypothetical protein [Catenulispora sp.]